MDASFFDRDGEWFVPRDVARGPWDANACHAGPPTGLLARASELAVEHQPLVRITVDLVRPIPHDRFRIEARAERSGRTVSTTSMQLFDGEGRAIVSARGMHLATNTEHREFPTVADDVPDFDASEPGPFAVLEAVHGLTWFGDAVEARYQPGVGPGIGPRVMWMRSLPLLADERPSPFQRICPLADCGNAISRNADPGPDLAFMNTDLTIVLHRQPDGEWFGSDVVSRWEPHGHGISDALLFDRHGVVGRALQTLLIR